jgi:DNA-directed RNA polymerase subunit RPC12/RpoP
MEGYDVQSIKNALSSAKVKDSSVREMLLSVDSRADLADICASSNRAVRICGDINFVEEYIDRHGYEPRNILEEHPNKFGISEENPIIKGDSPKGSYWQFGDWKSFVPDDAFSIERSPEIKKDIKKMSKKERKVLNQYKFTKDSSPEEEWVVTSEESYSPEEEEVLEARKEMGFVDEEYEICEAIKNKDFQNKIIRKLLKPVFMVMDSFGEGGYSEEINSLWLSYLEGDLEFVKLKRGKTAKCDACGHKRLLMYKYTETPSGDIKYLGGDCHAKYQTISGVAEIFNEISKNLKKRSLKCDNPEDREDIMESIRKRLDKVVKASKKMHDKYEGM